MAGETIVGLSTADTDVEKETSESIDDGSNSFSNQDKESKSSDEFCEEDEELLPLMNENNQDSDNEEFETPSDVAFAKTKRQEEEILQLIANVKVSGSSILNLRRKNLQTLPEELLELTQIQVTSLYLLE